MSWWSRLKNVFRRDETGGEIREELDFHLEMDRLKGHDTRGAMLRLGNPTRIKEEVREMRSIPALEIFLRDVRLGIRSLARSKSMTAAVILTLALGIGATTLIFSVVYGVLLKPLSYPEPEQLVSLAHATPSGPAGSADFLHLTYAEHNRTFQALGLWAPNTATVTYRGQPEQVRAVSGTPDVLSLLGVSPIRGRLFTDADGRPGSPLTTVLSFGYWQRRFVGDESILGQSLMIDNAPHEIVGIMPRDFRFLDVKADLFRAVQIDRSRVVQGNFAFFGIARLKPAISLDQVRADMSRMIPIAIDSFPAPAGITKDQIRRRGWAPDPKLLKDAWVGDVRDILWILMAAIGLVLLIVCANVMNLFLVRTEGRQRELSVRSALGAGRLRIVSGLFAEAAVLSTAGGVSGLVAAYAGLRFLLRNAPANLPRTSDIEMDVTVLAFGTLLTLGAAMLLGLAPVFRYGARPLGLQTGGRTMSMSRETRRMRAVLVAAQVGLALMLLIASGLMLRTYYALVHVNPGFQHSEGVQLAHLSFPRGPAFDAQQETQDLQQMVNAVAALPGVAAVAYASSVPLENGSPTSILFLEGFNTAGRLPAPRLVKFISPQYFRTLGVPLVAGRDLEWADHFYSRTVAIVSESLAKEVWGSAREALGKRVRTSPSDPWREIVGVAGDVREGGMNQPAARTVYFPFLMKNFWSNPTLFWGIGTLVVRTPRAGTEVFMEEMQRAVRGVNSSIPLAAPSTLDDLYRRSLSQTSLALVLLCVAGSMALLIGVVGIYGVIAYAVAQRRREIGIRIALGAPLRRVRQMFIKQALVLVSIGTGIGLISAFALTRLMSSLLYGVKAADPMTFVLMPILMAGIALLASYVPARRVLRVDPAQTLREE